MLTLTSVDSFVIQGRGRVYAVKGIEGLNPRPLLHTDVVMNGQRVAVIGVETFAIPDVTGRDFGLLVKE